VSRLDALLEALQVRLDAVAVCEVSRPRRLLAGPYETFVVHHVVRGSGVLDIEGRAPVAFQPDSMLLIPPGTRKRLCVALGDCVDVRAEDSCSIQPNELAYVDARGPAAADLTIVCGTIASSGCERSCIEGLAVPIVEDMSSEPIVRLAFRTMLAERCAPGLGSRALIEALMKQCLLLMLRKHFHRAGSLLSACLTDRRLRTALPQLQEQAGEIASLDAIARSAGMSRRRFVEHFTAATGTTPRQFTRQSRLRHAAKLLRSTDLDVGEIAAAIGYASRSHFSRAFRAAFGAHPNAFRRQEPDWRTT
jgi:AraC family transcriptional activator of mtrCDE